jgi:hypothetical protein
MDTVGRTAVAVVGDTGSVPLPKALLDRIEVGSRESGVRIDYRFALAVVSRRDFHVHLVSGA